MSKNNLISLHGGHSGRYCAHAEDLLEDFIKRYIALGFTTVGISEHIPPLNDNFIFPDEKALNLTVDDLNEKFEEYIHEINQLKKKYASKIRIFSGIEIESYTDSVEHIKDLISRFHPDYIVGSVHHVNDICFDFSMEEYDKAINNCGSINTMYETYFDHQYDMIKTFKPFVVGHFDLIRIFDKDYEKRLLNPEIQKRIERNLALIKSLNLVMDFNLRPLAKGKKEAYITPLILKRAGEMGITVIPGDDSHKIDEVGLNVDSAIKILESHGFNTRWPDPLLHSV